MDSDRGNRAGKPIRRRCRLLAHVRRIALSLSCLALIATVTLGIRSHWYSTGLKQSREVGVSVRSWWLTLSQGRLIWQLQIMEAVHVLPVGIRGNGRVRYFNHSSRHSPLDGWHYGVGPLPDGYQVFGFFITHTNDPRMRYKVFRLTLVAIPCWFLATLFGILPVHWLLRGRRNRLRQQRLRQGMCVHCGYDLRASKERCPECGELIVDAGNP